MDLPDGMTISVSVVDSDVVNALATLGGNVVFFTGLLDTIPNENALAMVMAHEIAHVKLRHPLRALGRGVVVAIAIAAVAGAANNEIVERLIGDTSMLTSLSFTRGQESAADKLAVRALEKTYGHTAGSTQLFKILEQEESKLGNHVPEFFATHPLTRHRIQTLQALSRENGWPVSGKMTPIPPQVKSELSKLHEKSTDKKVNNNEGTNR